jgi:hypothetical protein
MTVKTRSFIDRKFIVQGEIDDGLVKMTASNG